MTETRVMSLADGRELAWLEKGDPRGPAVFIFHGTPGSRLQVSFLDDAIASSGVRFIAPDRPGYGHSTFARQRKLIDWPRDATALADHLGIERFSVVGVSGGGPHAAACARFLAPRVRAAAIVSGLAPATDGDLNEGMSALNRFVLGPAKRSRFITYPFLALQDFVTHRWPERALQMALGQFPEPDRALLSQPHVKAAFIEDSRLSSATTAMACAQDFTLFARDWGFGLGDIAVPVDVWHGDVDRNVPFSHGKHQAERIPEALFHECPGEGHMLFITHFEEILRSVVSH